MAHTRNPVVTETTLITLVLLCVLGGLQYGSMLMEQRFTQAVHDELTLLLDKNIDTAEQSLQHWVDDQSAGVRYWAKQKLVLQAATALSTLPLENKVLGSAPAQQQLRDTFLPLMNEMGYLGFFIVDASLTNLASARDANLASTNLLAEQPEFFARMRAGDVALSLPLLSDVQLQDQPGDNKPITMFAGAPVHNSNNVVTHYLLFRLSVPRDFSSLFTAQQFGDSGELLAFDRQGRLLTRSRFEEQLIASGRLAPGQSSQLLPLLLQKNNQISPPAEQSLRTGSTQKLVHFTDYRGQPSEGIARWLPGMNFGLLAKIDQDEATETLRTGIRLMKAMTWGGSLMLLAFAAFIYLMRARNWRAQANYAAIFNNSGEGIITIDKQGIIDSINPAAARMFGYQEHELLGKNVNVLMPESLRAQHDEYVRKSEIYESRIINRSRELFGQHKDGHPISIELNVTRMQRGSEELFIGIVHDVSVRNAIETELRRFKTTLDQTLDCVFMFDPHTLKFFYANLGAQEQVGYSEKELLEMTPVDIKPDYNERQLRQLMAPMMNGELRSLNFESVHQHKNGSRIPVEISLQYVAPEHESPRMVAVVRNISERIESEQALRLTEDLLQRSQHIAQVGSWEWDIESGEIIWTDETYRLFGIEKEKHPTADYALFMSTIPGEDREQLEQALQAALKDDETPYDIEHPYILPDGEVRYAHELGRVYRDASGKPVKMTGVVQDITERVLAEQTLQREKAATEAANTALRMTQTALEYTGIGEFWIDARDGHIMHVSNHACEHLGYSRDELLKMQVADIAPGWPAEQWYTMTAPIRENGWGRFEGQHQRKDGMIVPVEVTAMYLPAYGEKDEMFVTFTMDISERKRTEEKLENYRRDLEQTVEERTAELLIANQRITLATSSAEIGIWELDLRDNSLIWDEWMYRLYGIDDDSFSGAYEAWEQGLHPDDLKAAARALRDAIDGEDEFNSEFRVVWPDGTVRWMKASAELIYDESGKPIRMIGTNQDITEKKSAAEYLESEVQERTADLEMAKQQAEAAVEAKSAFLATMSHEIRTPMNGVVGMIELLRNSQLNADQQRMLGVVHDSSFSLLRIIDDILDLSKIEAGKLLLEKAPLALADVIDSVADIMRPIAQNKPLRFYLYEDPQLPQQVLGDPVRLRQILYNLCGNAIKFCQPEVGTVELNARLIQRHEADDQRIWVRFSIIDNGIGMSEEVSANLFTPFYQAETSTTRRFGGTGLGLSICKNLTEMMGGTISVESMPQHGSTFSVELPFDQDETATPVEAAAIDDLVVLSYVPDVREWRNIDAYLQTTGCQHTVVSSEEAMREAVNSDRAPDVVVLFQPLSEPFPALLFDELHRNLPASTRYILVVPDAEVKMDISAKDTVLVENYPLKPRTLHIAIASAVGRASPEFNTLPEQLFEAHTPVDREQAREMNQLILVAEDNPTNQEVILRQLGLLGYAADMAADGREALEMWRQEPYALLLTDCHMPEMDGYQLAAAIRNEEAATQRAATTIVAITANALQGEGEKCLNSGMNGYLSKPLELQQLKLELERWLEPIVVDETKMPTSPAATSSADGLINVELMSRYLGHDRGMQQRYLKNCLNSARQTIQEIDEAIEQNDLQRAGELGHRCKSAVLAAGAEQMATVFKEIEMHGREQNREAILALQPRLNHLLQQFEKEVEKLS